MIETSTNHKNSNEHINIDHLRQLNAMMQMMDSEMEK